MIDLPTFYMYTQSLEAYGNDTAEYFRKTWYSTHRKNGKYNYLCTVLLTGQVKKGLTSKIL